MIYVLLVDVTFCDSINDITGNAFCLQMSPFDGALDVVDQTIFPINRDGRSGLAEALAESLVQENLVGRPFFLSMLFFPDFL